MVWKSCGLHRIVRGLCCAVPLALALTSHAQPPENERSRPTPGEHQARQSMPPEQRDAWRRAREERQRAWGEMTPDQRRDVWQQMSPEQREQTMRRMPPAERQEMWRKMTPEQREAMRQRFVERHDGSPHRGRPMSIEERQQLRQQIEEARRDVYSERERGRRPERRGGPRN